MHLHFYVQMFSFLTYSGNSQIRDANFPIYFSLFLDRAEILPIGKSLPKVSQTCQENPLSQHESIRSL